MLRRLFLLGCAGAVVAVGCLFWGFFVEPGRLVVREVVIDSAEWRGEPIRVGVLSDVHAGGRKVFAAEVARAVAVLNGLEPNIILLPGDFTTGSKARALRSAAEKKGIDAGHAELRKLVAPMGVFAVLGNHDHQYGRDTVRDALEADGTVQFVDNEVVVIGARVCVFGIADEWFGEPDLTTPDECPPGLNRIGFTHNPDTLLALETQHAFLAAGHTHGGQINIPGIGRRVTATRAGEHYAWGRVSFNGSPGFVTAGIGMSVLSARFRVPPEVVVVQLHEHDVRRKRGVLPQQTLRMATSGK